MSVAGPGFLWGGDANLKVWGSNLLFGQIFKKNCMKIKEIEPEAYLFEIDLMYVQHQSIKQTKGRGIQKWPCRKILSDIIENRIIEVSLLILFGGTESY